MADKHFEDRPEFKEPQQEDITAVVLKTKSDVRRYLSNKGYSLNSDIPHAIFIEDEDENYIRVQGYDLFGSELDLKIYKFSGEITDLKSEA